ncbi:PHP domain-containing protein [Kineosporia rhizophila]|uniref:PHP domain-containing protein n=1 Tax=Kineosporia rhizophila TaxID=84633 RepID=UPI001E28B3E1|nr:PHP domain-containing protein [Kineosporia rhizophila]MCE0534727.1 PHP domain-containing protein [Kineosporia rhizophila]
MAGSGSAPDRDPVTDLRRIAFLLERSLASSYRVKAFRGAASALLPLEPGEIRQAAADGKLTALKGVGEKSAAVIEQSVAGQVPDYLADLEQQAQEPLATGGEKLRAALRGDCHSHSDWSDGGSPPAEMAWTAKELGHEYLVLTDHSPRLKVANGLSAERLRRQLDVIEVINQQLAPFRVLTGIEVDILDDGSLDQDPELLARLDLVVASVHSKLAMPGKAMTRRMLAAIENPHTDVLGHCTGRMVRPREGRNPKGRAESEFDAAAVFAACQEHSTAVEINSRPERLDPPRRLLRQAVEAGCMFSIDTDAHAPGQLDWQIIGTSRAEECGVTADRVINTLGAEELLEWTRS